MPTTFITFLDLVLFRLDPNLILKNKNPDPQLCLGRLCQRVDLQLDTVHVNEHPV